MINFDSIPGMIDTFIPLGKGTGKTSLQGQGESLPKESPFLSMLSRMSKNAPVTSDATGGLEGMGPVASMEASNEVKRLIQELLAQLDALSSCQGGNRGNVEDALKKLFSQAQGDEPLSQSSVDEILQHLHRVLAESHDEGAKGLKGKDLNEHLGTLPGGFEAFLNVINNAFLANETRGGDGVGDNSVSLGVDKGSVDTKDLYSFFVSILADQNSEGAFKKDVYGQVRGVVQGSNESEGFKSFLEGLKKIEEDLNHTVNKVPHSVVEGGSDDSKDVYGQVRGVVQGSNESEGFKSFLEGLKKIEEDLNHTVNKVPHSVVEGGSDVHEQVMLSKAVQEVFRELITGQDIQASGPISSNESQNPSEASLLSIGGSDSLDTSEPGVKDLQVAFEFFRRLSEQTRGEIHEVRSVTIDETPFKRSGDPKNIHTDQGIPDIGNVSQDSVSEFPQGEDVFILKSLRSSSRKWDDSTNYRFFEGTSVKTVEGSPVRGAGVKAGTEVFELDSTLKPAIENETGTVGASVSKTLDGKAEELLNHVKGARGEQSRVQDVSNVGLGSARFQGILHDQPTGDHVVYSPGTQEKVDQVELVRSIGNVLAHSAAKGESRAVLRLHPPELGRIRVDLLVDQRDQSVKASFLTEVRDVKGMIEQHGHLLRDTLAQHGIRLDGFHVDVSSSGHGNAFERNGAFEWTGEGPWGGRRQVAGLLSMSMETGEAEKDDEIGPLAWWSGRGLSIKV